MSGIQQLLFATKGQAGIVGILSLSDQTLGIVGTDVALRVGYELGSDGKAYKALSGSNVLLEQWVTPPVAAWQFEVFVTVATAVGGTVNGTIGAWLPMTIAHQWYIQANTSTNNESITATLAVTLRKVGDTGNIDTAYIYLSAHK